MHLLFYFLKIRQIFQRIQRILFCIGRVPENFSACRKIVGGNSFKIRIFRSGLVDFDKTDGNFRIVPHKGIGKLIHRKFIGDRRKGHGVYNRNISAVDRQKFIGILVFFFPAGIDPYIVPIERCAKLRESSERKDHEHKKAMDRQEKSSR